MTLCTSVGQCSLGGSPKRLGNCVSSIRSRSLRRMGQSRLSAKGEVGASERPWPAQPIPQWWWGCSRPMRSPSPPIRLPGLEPGDHRRGSQGLSVRRVADRSVAKRARSGKGPVRWPGPSGFGTRLPRRLIFNDGEMTGPPSAGNLARTVGSRGTPLLQARPSQCRRPWTWSISALHAGGSLARGLDVVSCQVQR